MRILTRFCCALFAAAFVAAAQPVVFEGGVLNAASYSLPGLPNGGIAQGSIFVVFGSNMGPGSIVYNPPGAPLAKVLPAGNGTSIKVTVGSTTVDCLMFYTSAGQVAALLPSSTPVGAGTLTLTYNGQASAPVSIQVMKGNFGIFALNQAGSGPGVVQNYISDAERPFNMIQESAHRGQVETIWGTGLGAITGDETMPPLGAPVESLVEVWIGGKKAEVQYKGRSYEFAGEDQINFKIPDDAPLGCYVPLAVVVSEKTGANPVVSNYTTISIASSGKTCSDEGGYTAADIEKAKTSGTMRAANIALSRIGLSFATPLGTLDIRSDSGSGSFVKYDFNSQLTRARSATQSTVIGSCVVYQFKGDVNSAADIEDPVKPAGLDAGASLTVTGPKGTKQLPKDAQLKGEYYASLGGGMTAPEYLDPGNYTISGPGGTDVGAFSVSLTVPAALVWTNKDAITTVVRSAGQLITWTGGGANDYVTILGASTRTSPAVGAAFVCTERASKGSFTIPALVLSSLPQSVTQDGVPTGALMIGSVTAPVRFTASGLDVAQAMHMGQTMKNVAFQ